MQNIIYPVQYVLYKTGSSIIRAYKSYFESFEIAGENIKLKEDLVRLQTKLSDYNELKKQITQFEQLLRFSKAYKFDQLEIAEVVGNVKHFMSRGIRVSSGSLKGVKPGMPVVVPGGLVGKVLRTSFYFSDVQFVTDDNFVLDVFIERTRTRTLIRGSAQGSCFLSVQSKVDVRLGDKIITSVC